jgi:hypothetical protein
MGPPQYGGPPMAAGQSTNGKAIASLILGIISIVFCFGFLTGVPAIILGRMAKQEIAAGNGTGDGLAQGGLITGIIGTALSLLVVVGWIILIVVAGTTN